MELPGLLILGFSGALAGGALWIGARWLRTGGTQHPRARRAVAHRGPQGAAMVPKAAAPGPRRHRVPPVLREVLPTVSEVVPAPAAGRTFPPAAAAPAAVLAAQLAVPDTLTDTHPGWGESSFFPPTQPAAMSEFGAQFAETQPMPLDMR